MKEKKMVCVHADENYHEKVKHDLEVARTACQRLLNEFNKLDIGIITDMDELQVYPEKCYKNALEKLIPIPAASGRFAVNKEAIVSNYLATHNVPGPETLTRVAKETQKVLYCSVPGLFITDGQTVSLDEGISNFYITMNDIVISESEPDKIALAADLQTWIKLTNSINVRLNGELYDSSSPVSNRFFFGKCEFENTNGRGANGTLVFSLEALRRWLSL